MGNNTITNILGIIGYLGFVFGGVVYFQTIKKTNAYKGIDKTLELNQKTINSYESAVEEFTRQINDLRGKVNELTDQNTAQSVQIQNLQDTVNSMSDTTDIANFLKTEVAKSAAITKEYGGKIDLILNAVLKDGKSIVNVNTK